MCMLFGCNPQIIFVTFSKFGVNHSVLKAFRHLLSCERNSSYSFSRICLKLCRCFLSISEAVHDVCMQSSDSSFLSFLPV